MTIIHSFQVYIGSRPKQPLTRPPPPTEEEVESNDNLRMWLEKRNIAPSFFCFIVTGQAPAKALPFKDEPATAKTAAKSASAYMEPPAKSARVSNEPRVYDWGHMEESWSPTYPAAPVKPVKPVPSQHTR